MQRDMIFDLSDFIAFLESYMKKYLKSKKRNRYLRKYRRKSLVLAKSSASRIKGLKVSFVIIDDPLAKGDQ